MEAEAIGKGLHPCCLPDREGPVLLVMDVPVAVLRHVSRDGQARLLRLEDVVFIAEAVLLVLFIQQLPFSLRTAGYGVAALFLTQLVISEPGISKLEGL